MPEPLKSKRCHPKAVIYSASLILLLCLLPLSLLSQNQQRNINLPAAKPRLLVVAAHRSNGQQPAPQEGAPLPQLVDITDSTGIEFNHLSSPEQKYIVESMSGGVALIDYDRDG